MNIENFLKKSKLLSFVVIFLTAFIFLPNLASADTGMDSAMKGMNASAATGFGDKQTTTVADTGIATDVPTIIGKVVGSILAMVGIIFLILMIYGGFTWMLARGNEAEITKAKDMIIAAIVGLIIVLSAYAITSFLGTQLI